MVFSDKLQDNCIEEASWFQGLYSLDLRMMCSIEKVR